MPNNWDKNPSRRRDFLIASTSVVCGVAATAAAIPFLVSWQPNARARALGAPIKVDLGKLSVGQILVVAWRGKPIYVVHRAQQQIAQLNKANRKLADPDSLLENQPEYVKGVLRSLRPQYAVLEGVCTHLGCAPKFRPVPRSSDLGADWEGGFFCPCHGSKFDMAGRVFSGTPAAPNNLLVPPHRYESDSLLIIGADLKGAT